MLLGLDRIVGHQVGLADVLVGTAMARVELERLLVVREGRLELAALAIRVAEVVLDVRVAGVAERGGGERPDRTVPVLGADGRLPCRIVRIEPAFLRLFLTRIGEARARPDDQAEREPPDGEPSGGVPDAHRDYRPARRG